MSDGDLRRAERAAHRDGDPEAAARLLVARVRAGTLAPERLRHAAALGHPDARRALDAPDPAPTFARVDDLVDAAPDDVGLAVRALAAAVRRIAPAEPDPISAGRVDAALAWCDCPCPTHAAAAYKTRDDPEFALGLRGPFVEGALRVAEAAGLAGRGTVTRDFLGVGLRCVREGAGDDEAAITARVREDLLAFLLA